MCDDGQHGGLAGRTARALGKDVALAVVFRVPTSSALAYAPAWMKFGLTKPYPLLLGLEGENTTVTRGFDSGTET